MSSHPVSIPSGLTRGYSNSFTDMLIRVGCSTDKDKPLTISDLDILDEQQVEGGQ